MKDADSRPIAPGNTAAAAVSQNVIKQATSLIYLTGSENLYR